VFGGWHRRPIAQADGQRDRRSDAAQPAREAPSEEARSARKGEPPGPPDQRSQERRIGPAREGLEARSHPLTATAEWN